MSDLLALLDALDGLHGAATEGEWFVATGCSWRRILIVGPDSPVVVPTIERDGHPDLHATMPTLESIVALHNAYPRLAQALRAALTPATDGEREARRVANEAGDADMDNIGHLRHTLTLLDNERLSHTDEVRRLDLEIDRLRTECIRRATDRDSARAEVAALTKQLNHKVTP